jgi:putative cell wall-binding protein
MRYETMMKRNIKQQLNAKLTEMNMNLANNYKDLAHDALKELDRMVENFKASGDLKEKDYQKMRRMVDDYKRKLADYHH